MDRLGQLQVPTLVLAGRDDSCSPPEHQLELAAGIPNARLRIVERGRHNAHAERPADVLGAVTESTAADEHAPAADARATRRGGRGRTA